MDSEKFKALLCAVETGSLSTAAETLGYTPSGISRMMAALEEELGFQLLIRSRDGVRMTPECQAMLPSIQDFIHYGEACRQMAAALRGLEVGTVVIGTAYSAFYRWLSHGITTFHRQYPGIQIELVSGYSSELLEKMQAHQLDLCIISKRSGHHGWIPLCADPMMVWVPADHPLAGKSAVPIEAFASVPTIETFRNADIDNTRIFQKYQITPDTRFYTRDSYATWQMVDAALGISLNNGLIGREWTGNVKRLPLYPEETIEIGIASPENMPLAVKAFLSHLKSLQPEIDRPLEYHSEENLF